MLDKNTKLNLLLIISFFICNTVFSGELVLKQDENFKMDLRNFITWISDSPNEFDLHFRTYKNSFGKNPLEWNDKDIDLIKKYINDDLKREESILSPLLDKSKIDTFFKILKEKQGGQGTVKSLIKEASDNGLLLKEDASWFDSFGCFIGDIAERGDKSDYCDYAEGGKKASSYKKSIDKWNDKDFDIVERFIKLYKYTGTSWTGSGSHYAFNVKKYFPKFKEYVKNRQKADELEKIIKLSDFNGQWDCKGEYISLNVSADKPIIALSGHEEIYDLKVSNWNEKEGKVTIEFKLPKGQTAFFADNTLWNLSLENKKKTLVAKTESETVNFKKISDKVDTQQTIKRVIPNFEKLDEEFLKSRIVRPYEIAGLSVKETVIRIVNMKQTKYVPVDWKIGDNEYTLTLKYQNGEKTIKLIFTHQVALSAYVMNGPTVESKKSNSDSEKNTFSTVKIVAETRREATDFLKYYVIELANDTKWN